MKYLCYLFAVLVTLVLFAPVASADWEDNFDSYVLGSGLHGQGGWAGWDNDPAWDAYVTDIYAYSAPHSVEIIPTSDIVQEFSETSGKWVMEAWHYIPSGSTGEQFFILLNTYTPGGPYAWSMDLMFDSDAGTVTVKEGTGVTSIINDQWVEVMVKINLDTDTQEIYYDGTLLDAIGWSGTGVVEIAALDLFSNGGSTINWDDCHLWYDTSALQPATWGHIKTTLQ